MKTEQTESELETAYLLRSDHMRQRLIGANQRIEGIPFEAALKLLGIDPHQSF